MTFPSSVVPERPPRLAPGPRAPSPPRPGAPRRPRPQARPLRRGAPDPAPKRPRRGRVHRLPAPPRPTASLGFTITAPPPPPAGSASRSPSPPAPPSPASRSLGSWALRRVGPGGLLAPTGPPPLYGERVEFLGTGEYLDHGDLGLHSLAPPPARGRRPLGPRSVPAPPGFAATSGRPRALPRSREARERVTGRGGGIRAHTHTLPVKAVRG